MERSTVFRTPQKFLNIKIFCDRIRKSTSNTGDKSFGQNDLGFLFIEQTDAKIMKLTSELEELEGTLAATVQSILNTKDDIKAMEDARKEQHAAFESAKSDDEGAVKLLAAAIESMTAFYKNNKIDQGESVDGGNSRSKSLAGWMADRQTDRPTHGRTNELTEGRSERLKMDRSTDRRARENVAKTRPKARESLPNPWQKTRENLAKPWRKLAKPWRKPRKNLTKT